MPYDSFSGEEIEDMEGDSMRRDAAEAQADTAPFVRSRRVKRFIRIREVNTPPVQMFDVGVEYPSDALPEWFAPLQPIVEDDTFTNMTIYLGSKTRYIISIVE